MGLSSSQSRIFPPNPRENIDDQRRRVNRPFAGQSHQPVTLRDPRAKLGAMSRRRRAAPHVACAVGLVLVGWGVVRVADPAHADFALPASVSTPWPARLWASVQAPPLGPAVPAVPPPAPPVERPPLLKPVRIALPTLGVRASIVPVAVGRNGALAVPEDPRVVGWWAGGGDALVLDGHVDTAAQGPGALFHLVDLAAGDAIELTGADGGVRRFAVTQVHAFAKATLPPEVFRSPARLVIITCGGHFDRHRLQYDDNVVAYAEPV